MKRPNYAPAGIHWQGKPVYVELESGALCLEEDSSYLVEVTNDCQKHAIARLIAQRRERSAPNGRTAPGS